MVSWQFSKLDTVQNLQVLHSRKLATLLEASDCQSQIEIMQHSAGNYPVYTYLCPCMSIDLDRLGAHLNKGKAPRVRALVRKHETHTRPCGALSA